MNDPRRIVTEPAGIGAGLAAFVGELIELVFKTLLVVLESFSSALRS